MTDSVLRASGILQYGCIVLKKPCVLKFAKDALRTQAGGRDAIAVVTQIHTTDTLNRPR
jgi:hypothetical protein